MESTMRHRYRIVIRVFGLLGLLAALFLAVDLGAAAGMLLSAEPAPIVAAAFLVQLQIVLSALRWRFTAARLGHMIGRGRAIGEYYLASLLNLVVPGGVGGDALRALRAGTAKDRDPATAGSVIVRAVVLERLAGQIAFFAIALAGVAVWPQLLGGKLPEGAGFVLALPPLFLALAACAAAGAARFAPPRIGGWFAGLGPDIRRAWWARLAWLVQGSMSLAIAAFYIAAFALASAAVGAPLAWAAWLTIVPLVLLTMLIPASVGGFGLREGAAAALWPLAGHGAAEGVAAAFLYGLVAIAGSLPGLTVLFRSPGAYRARRA
jgi:uncharacterized membrane protein YbhN (UPF0104 family)